MPRIARKKVCQLQSTKALTMASHLTLPGWSISFSPRTTQTGTKSEEKLGLSKK